jgi:hypothetical protein
MVSDSYDSLFDYWEAMVVPPYRRLAYYFALHKGEDNVCFFEHGLDVMEEKHEGLMRSGMFVLPFIHQIDMIKVPEWVKHSIFYQIFPDRFSNGDKSIDPPGTVPFGSTPTRDNYMGGDLQGILNKLAT